MIGRYFNHPFAPLSTDPGRWEQRFNGIHNRAIILSADPTMLSIEIKMTLVRLSASS